MSFLGIAFDQINSKILSEAIDTFVNKNELKLNPVAWEFSNQGIFILKTNIWFDKAPGIITDIEIHDEINRKIYYFEDLNTVDLDDIKLDPSLYDSKLKKFIHYDGEIISSSPENPRSISIVFRLPKESNLNNLDLIIKFGNKIFKNEIKSLISEIPRIFDYVNQRNNNSLIKIMENLGF